MLGERSYKPRKFITNKIQQYQNKIKNDEILRANYLQMLHEHLQPFQRFISVLNFANVWMSCNFNFLGNWFHNKDALKDKP